MKIYLNVGITFLCSSYFFFSRMLSFLVKVAHISFSTSPKSSVEINSYLATLNLIFGILVHGPDSDAHRKLVLKTVEFMS